MNTSYFLASSTTIFPSLHRYIHFLCSYFGFHVHSTNWVYACDLRVSIMVIWIINVGFICQTRLKTMLNSMVYRFLQISWKTVKLSRVFLCTTIQFWWINFSRQDTDSALYCMVDFIFFFRLAAEKYCVFFFCIWNVQKITFRWKDFKNLKPEGRGSLTNK